jgi:hypothetical protein
METPDLIGPASPLGYPAPYWFLALFKVLGFTCHAVPMNLAYAGLLLALLLRASGNEHARQWAGRLARQMPFIVAWAVNLGIVPLLFTQVAYYQVFYPAMILMAWPWLGIIPLLTLAYYGVYIYAAGFRLGGPGPTRFKQSAGWVSALLFLAIGFIFTSAFALMTNISAWPALWQQTSVAGAPLGIAHSLANPTLWPRWLLMLGLALTTTAAYVVVDTGWFAQKESGAYKQWTARFGLEVYSAGVVLFVVAGVAYVFGGWPAELRQLLFTNPVFMLAAISAGLPWLLILAQVRQGAITQGLAMATGLGQSGVLALNAISRQLAQNAELEKYLDVTGQPVQVDWSPMILFLVLFAAGLALVIWMVRKVLIAVRGPEP